MSYTTVLAVAPDRRPAELMKFRNSWGWAPSIWARLMQFYDFGWTWIHHEPVIDALFRDIDSLPAWQQVPLILTSDTGVIPGEDAKWAADQLEEFEQRTPEEPDRVNHVPTMVDLLRSQPEAPFIGVWSTSVTENPFDPWDEEADAPCSGIPLEQMSVLQEGIEMSPGREAEP